jgi:hypothetical protein
MFHNWNFSVSSIFHSDRNCWFTFRFLFSSVDYYLMWPRQTTIPPFSRAKWITRKST